MLTWQVLLDSGRKTDNMCSERHHMKIEQQHQAVNMIVPGVYYRPKKPAIPSVRQLHATVRNRLEGNLHTLTRHITPCSGGACPFDCHETLMLARSTASTLGARPWWRR